MKRRFCGLSIAAFAGMCLFLSAQSFAQNAYITNVGDASVSVINTATNTVSTTITDPGFNSPVAFGVFIIRPSCAGIPRFSNCHGKSVSALAHQFGGLNAEAAALGFPDVQVLQNAITAFCRGQRQTSEAHPLSGV
jgi:YVTN family beta-propeller protein